MTKSRRRIVVGTRGSALALRQSELIMETLRERLPDLELSLRTVETEGDRTQTLPISQFGDKGVFVRALERALLQGQIDLAVHSLKDVPTDVEIRELELVAFSVRADPRDCLVSREGLTLEQLPEGTRVGTSSLRRRVLLEDVRPDFVISPIRGNVDTRLRKVDEGQYDAIILAAAGLHRLDLQHVIAEYLPVDLFVPDAGQGIIAVQGRKKDDTADLVSAIDQPASRAAATAERAAVRALGANCRSPVGVYATIDGEAMMLRGVAASEDGMKLRRAEQTGPASQAEALGRSLGTRLLALLNT